MENKKINDLYVKFCKRIVSDAIGDDEDGLTLVYKDKENGWKNIPYNEENLNSIFRNFQDVCTAKRIFLGEFVIFIKKECLDEEFNLHEIVCACKNENIESAKILLIKEYLDGNNHKQKLEQTKSKLEEMEKKVEKLKNSIAEQTAEIDSCTSECEEIEKSLGGEKDMVERCFVKFHYGSNTFDVKTLMVKKTKGEKSMRIQQDNSTCYNEWIGVCPKSKLNECKVKMIEDCMKDIEDRMMKKDGRYDSYIGAKNLRDSLLK